MLFLKGKNASSPTEMEPGELVISKNNKLIASKIKLY
jgi:hypothetical protein